MIKFKVDYAMKTLLVIFTLLSFDCQDTSKTKSPKEDLRLCYLLAYDIQNNPREGDLSTFHGLPRHWN